MLDYYYKKMPYIPLVHNNRPLPRYTRLFGMVEGKGRVTDKKTGMVYRDKIVKLYPLIL